MGEVESEGQRLANEWADECLTADAALAIDAALRRAKVDVLEDLSNLLTYSRFNSYEQRMCERGCGLTKEGRIGASIGLAWALGELDALATLQKGRT